MVGVAGKSKGCATCRKRKIKCDEARPVCKRCEHSRLHCEGYHRFPIFIDRDQTGYRKRVPLEEVKPDLQLRRIFSLEAESTRLISWFREEHIRSPPSKHGPQSQTRWLSLVGARQSPHPALKAALLAISFARWNRIECNPDLRQSGRKHYQQALELTQKALLRTEDALSDDILATACVMTLYELSDPNCLRSDSWLDHITGTGNLFCLRGPRSFDSAESRAMFEHIRYIFMIRCLAIRASCVFGSPQWRQLPWCHVSKSIEQQVFDQGLRLASLWKECDSLLIHEHRSSELNALLSTCIDISERLDPLIAQISSEAARIGAIGTANPATLLLSITALGIQLGVAASAHKLLNTTGVAVSGHCIAIVGIASETVAKAHSLRKARRQLARDILCSVEARMEAQFGALDASRMSWSLQLAREQFTVADSEAEQCKSVLTLLSQRTSPFDALGLPLGKHASSPVYHSF